VAKWGWLAGRELGAADAAWASADAANIFAARSASVTVKRVNARAVSDAA
jgi:hypothetical protein